MRTGPDSTTEASVQGFGCEIFHSTFPDDSLIKLDKKYDQRIAVIFKKELGLIKIRKQINGEQKNRWYITEKKLKELQAKNAIKTVPEVDKLADDLKDDKIISTSGEIPF